MEVKEEELKKEMVSSIGCYRTHWEWDEESPFGLYKHRNNWWLEECSYGRVIRTESRLEGERDCEGNKVVGLVNLAVKGRGDSLDTGKGKGAKVCVCVCVHVCTCVCLRTGEI